MLSLMKKRWAHPSINKKKKGITLHTGSIGFLSIVPAGKVRIRKQGNRVELEYVMEFGLLGMMPWLFGATTFLLAGINNQGKYRTELLLSFSGILAVLFIACATSFYFFCEDINVMVDQLERKRKGK